jgi:tetratricopeptide (TPR) repeat protein
MRLVHTFQTAKILRCNFTKEAVMRKVLRVSLLTVLATSMVVATNAQQTNEKDQLALTYNNQAVNEITNERYEVAIQLLNHAIRLKPDFARAYYNLGTAYQFLGQSQTAVNALQKAIELNPFYAEAYNQLGFVYVGRAEYEKAVAAFEKSIAQNPNDAIPYYNLGCVQVRLEQFEVAVEALKRAVELQPLNVEARINLGFANSRLKKYAAAIEQIREAVRLQPDDVEAQFFLGSLYALNGDKQSALAQQKLLQPLDANLASKLHHSIYKDKILTIAKQR